MCSCPCPPPFSVTHTTPHTHTARPGKDVPCSRRFTNEQIGEVLLLGLQGWARLWHLLLQPHAGAPQWCPLVPPQALGPIPQLPRTRPDAGKPRPPFVSEARSCGPESSRKCHRGPPRCPGKGWCRAGRAPNIEGGGRRLSSHGGPRLHALSWSLSPTVLEGEGLWGEQATRINCVETWPCLGERAN